MLDQLVLVDNYYSTPTVDHKEEVEDVENLPRGFSARISLRS